ncbi:hypothetical protein [Novosphingobium nitrogenifigens]|uniref:hypothetical protein n=1 Tax=Novosphingobium nitrogenifigens TaxID=378548 RepID=UPI000A85D7DD|nr:hypothetical protein [Novosphingobium nitrogenifigens]
MTRPSSRRPAAVPVDVRDIEALARDGEHEDLPREEEEALRALLRAQSGPALPPGLAERIVREVPRLAQLPADPSGERCADVDALPSAWSREPESVAAAAGSDVRPAGALRRHGWLAGLASLAAGLALLALIQPRGGDAPVSSGSQPMASIPARSMEAPAAAPEMVTSSEALALTGQQAGAPRAESAVPQVSASSTGMSSAAAPTAAPTEEPQPAEPVVPVAPAAQLARGPVAGPVADPGESTGSVTPALGTHGIMGPVLQQGYGFGGGTVGGGYGLPGNGMSGSGMPAGGMAGGPTPGGPR